jgi:hypothetical protein
MPFQPGQVANPEGRRKEKLWHATLHRACVQDDGNRVRKAVEQLLDLAAAGEQWAIKELADRLDGRPAQMIVGDADEPLQVNQIIRTIVDPTDSNT